MYSEADMLTQHALRIIDQIKQQLMEEEARVVMGEFREAARADPFGSAGDSDPNIIEGEVVSVETVKWPETLPLMLREAVRGTDG